MRTCRFCGAAACLSLGYSDLQGTHRCRKCDLVYRVRCDSVSEALQVIRQATNVEQLRRALAWPKDRQSKVVQRALEARIRKLERSAKR